MSKLMLLFMLLSALALPVNALEITAPQIPASAQERMPENTESFADGLAELLQKALQHIRPDLAQALETSVRLTTAVMILSLLRTFSGKVKLSADIVGSVTIAVILLQSANSMIYLGSETIHELSDYGKLLYPVMTAAVAAQGGITSSTALYTGTAIFDTVLTTVIEKLLLPAVYVFLALATANSVVGEDVLRKMGDTVKSCLSWCLKTVLIVFTTYMSITGVVSGTTDAVALKATKVTISSVVPVVGGILSDASEAVLVSAGMVKNAAGVYGILALLTLFLEPFLRIGVQYLILKITTAVCGIFGSKSVVGLMEDFSTAMGLILAMTGAVCLLLLISTVCFMKGVG